MRQYLKPISSTVQRACARQQSPKYFFESPSYLRRRRDTDITRTRRFPTGPNCNNTITMHEYSAINNKRSMRNNKRRNRRPRVYTTYVHTKYVIRSIPGLGQKALTTRNLHREDIMRGSVFREGWVGGGGVGSFQHTLINHGYLILERVVLRCSPNTLDKCDVSYFRNLELNDDKFERESYKCCCFGKQLVLVLTLARTLCATTVAIRSDHDKVHMT